MLQVEKVSVFVPDVLANILIVATLPLIAHTFGNDILPAIFLWNAIIFFSIYTFSANGPLLKTWLNRIWKANISNRHLIQAVVMAAMFIPVFFQLSGGILNDPNFKIDYAGNVTLVPLPISLIICFAITVTMLKYS